MLFIRDYNVKAMEISEFLNWYLPNVYLKENKLNKNGEEFSPETILAYQAMDRLVTVQIIDLANEYIEDITEDVKKYIEECGGGNIFLITETELEYSNTWNICNI